MIDIAKLIDSAARYGVALSREQGEQFDRYAALLVEWNEKVNLTAILDPEEILIKHFLDSLTLLTLWDPQRASDSAQETGQGDRGGGSIPSGEKRPAGSGPFHRALPVLRVMDVGTGAGFPGIPLKIARPELEVTLLDSLNKRVRFLEAVSLALDLPLTCVHSRAEDAGRNSLYREQFDLVTARAVANLRELAEYCLPLVKKGGVFLSMKGPEVEEELEGAGRAIQLLGGRISTVEKLQLPMDYGRALVQVEKISQTPAKYPRLPGKIAKNPLV